jgi:hypothetical protein
MGVREGLSRVDLRQINTTKGRDILDVVKFVTC